jgi:hypothetical protein
VCVEKDLSAAPSWPEESYFDESYSGVPGAVSGGGLGRKTSLMKKAKGLMRGK